MVKAEEERIAIVNDEATGLDGGGIVQDYAQTFCMEFWVEQLLIQ